MILVQSPPSNYRERFDKGHFYRCPFIFPLNQIYIVRPIYDTLLNDEFNSTVIPMDKCNDAFSHLPYKDLKLVGDEEYVMGIAKRRRVLAITKPDKFGYIKVAPVKTLKEEKHSKYFDLAKLRKNELPGILYLEESKYNDESFIPLIESCPTYMNLLEPMAHVLNSEGINVLDDHLIFLHDLGTDSTQ